MRAGGSDDALRRKLKADVVVRWYCGTRTRMYAGLVAVGQDVARRRRSEQKKRRGRREQIAGLSGQAGSQSVTAGFEKIRRGR